MSDMTDFYLDSASDTLVFFVHMALLGFICAWVWISIIYFSRRID